MSDVQQGQQVDVGALIGAYQNQRNQAMNAAAAAEAAAQTNYATAERFKAELDAARADGHAGAELLAKSTAERDEVLAQLDTAKLTIRTLTAERDMLRAELASQAAPLLHDVTYTIMPGGASETGLALDQVIPALAANDATPGAAA